jgi:dUTP pyrophosphatase
MILKYAMLSTKSVAPKRATKHAAGYDLTAVSAVKMGEGLYEYDTGIAVAIPEGYVGLVFPRSSVSNTGAHLANSCGVIDSDYRGPIKVRFYADSAPYNPMDRVAQLVIIPIFESRLERVDRLDDTERGTGGFGSTGVK